MDNTVDMCKKRATRAMEHFLHVLGFVPEDKLHWTPTPTAKSALQIAAHCAGYSGGFATIIRAGSFPSRVEDFLGPIEAAIASVTTVEEAKEMLRKGIANTLAALDTVQPDQLDATIQTPQGQTPFAFFMNVPALHLHWHTGQIDYLQTCWGDLEVHV